LIWWLDQPSRADQERIDVAELQERSPWLTGLTFCLNGLQLVADFTLTVSGETIDLRIAYPDFFPNVPAAIRPKKPDRLSGHQWGAGGELCLEYRADNWSPEITGAMMIESAYRLLSGEVAENAPPLPSAHRMSLGQEVRASKSRFLLTDAALEQLAAISPDTPADIKFVDFLFDRTWFAQPTELSRDGASFWSEPAIYSDDVPLVRSGKVLRLRTDQPLPHDLTLERLRGLVSGTSLEGWPDEGVADTWVSVVLVKDETARLFMLLPNDKFGLAYRTIRIPQIASRLPSNHVELTEKQVAIVGCGSIGSKVAVSLARSGVRKFLLIDADLFYPGNVVRNELDLRAVGANKASAVGRAITSVQSAAEVTVRNISLGGQEASESTSLTIRRLASCDLIVDATADPTAFALCALVSRSERRPMAWAQVYAGGVGGMVARARPDLDPPPVDVRAQIENWYAARGVPWLENEGIDYDLLPADQPPMIADDADVSVIAAHLTRLVIDTLVRPTTSAFPCSAYCIGLSKSWIFDAPFDTWPIQYTPGGTWGAVSEENAVERLKDFVAHLMISKEEGSENSAR
jgi:molybdopterin/thiamine biosynthesis adenylyltransferase